MNNLFFDLNYRSLRHPFRSHKYIGKIFKNERMFMKDFIDSYRHYRIHLQCLCLLAHTFVVPVN